MFARSITTWLCLKIGFSEFQWIVIVFPISWPSKGIAQFQTLPFFRTVNNHPSRPRPDNPRTSIPLSNACASFTRNAGSDSCAAHDHDSEKWSGLWWLRHPHFKATCTILIVMAVNKTVTSCKFLDARSLNLVPHENLLWPWCCFRLSSSTTVFFEGKFNLAKRAYSRCKCANEQI